MNILSEKLSSESIILVSVVVLCIALIILDIVLLVRMNLERRRLDRFLTGTDGANLEEAFAKKFEVLETLSELDEEKAGDIKDLYRRVKGSYQKLGIVRYDAYLESGGNLSFALAMLDETNSGFVLNVMNGRDGSYCYVKEISRGECDLSLGDEEIEAIQKAMSK